MADIFDYGFSKGLNRNQRMVESIVVYNPFVDTIQAQNIDSGSNLGGNPIGPEGIVDITNRDTLIAPSITTDISTIFESSSRFSVPVTGSGVASLGVYGLSLSSGATASSSAICRLLTVIPSGTIFDGDPTVCIKVNTQSINTANGSGSVFLGIGNVGINNDGHIFTGSTSIGFKMVKSGGVVSLYATQGNGTENAKFLETFTANDTYDLGVKLFSSKNPKFAKYFWRKNLIKTFSTLTLEKNFPTTGGGGNVIQCSVVNDATAFTTAVLIISAKYSR